MSIETVTNTTHRWGSGVCDENIQQLQKADKNGSIQLLQLRFLV